MAKKFLLHSKEESSMVSSWTDSLYCSILKNGNLSLHYNVNDEYGSDWSPAIRDIETPKDFINAFRSIERIEHWEEEDLLPSMHLNHPIFAIHLEQYLKHEEYIEEMNIEVRSKINALVKPFIDLIETEFASGITNASVYAENIENYVIHFVEKTGEFPKGKHSVGGKNINFPTQSN